MENIDDYIRRSETDKELELRPELWRRLERRLDDDVPYTPTTSIWRPWMIAASVMMLFGFSLFWKASNTYQVEDLSADMTPGFSKEELALFEYNYTNYPPTDYSG